MEENEVEKEPKSGEQPKTRKSPKQNLERGQRKDEESARKDKTENQTCRTAQNNNLLPDTWQTNPKHTPEPKRRQKKTQTRRRKRKRQRRKKKKETKKTAPKEQRGAEGSRKRTLKRRKRGRNL